MIPANHHPDRTAVRKRLLAAMVSTGVACATLASALAAAQSPKAAAPPGRETVVVQEVKVQKKAGPPPRKPARKPGALKGVVRIERAQVLGMDMEAQVEQFLQQFRPILRAEYHVLRVACELTPGQRQGLARAAERTLRDATRKYLETMRRPMTAAQRSAIEPRRLIQEGLSQAVQAQLPPEQAARYQEELSRRNADRRRLAVRNLIARLDQDLVLSARQRDQLDESLTSHWDDAWGQSLELFTADHAFLPPIPDQHVAPFLNESQKKIWRGTQKVRGFFGGF